MKVQGAYDKPFWMYKRLNNCAAPTPASDDVLVVEEEVFLCAGLAKEATTKTSSLAGVGAAQLFLHAQYTKNRYIMRKHTRSKNLPPSHPTSICSFFLSTLTFQSMLVNQ